MRRVVVTGLGAVTPIGNNLADYHAGLREGRSGAELIERFDTTNFKTKFAGVLHDFDSEQYVSKRDQRRIDLYDVYAYAAADEAMADSGIDLEKIDRDRFGVIVGSGIGGLSSLEANIEEVTLSGQPRYSPFMIPQMIADGASGLLSIRFGLRGVNYATVSACATSSHAIMAAFDTIRLGRNDLIMTGGAEASVTKVGVGGFNSMKALSTRNDDYKTASRPFDADRDGFVLGEGSGILILEELEHAKARGARIYAEVIGAGATADAYHITAPHPEGLGATNVMKMALADAGINAEDVDYVNVHGTSTPLGDVAELKAIQQAFGEAAYQLNVSSTKSMTGHLLGAAGAIESIACILAIQHKFVPPTINHFTDDPAIDSRLNLTFNEAQERDVKVALSNTFGFGGKNSSVVFRRFD